MSRWRLILFGALALLATAFGASLLYASDGSSVATTATQTITAFGICKKVTNSSPTAKTVYVPTQSSIEWLSFYSNPPVGVTIGSCATAITVPSGANLDLCALAGNPTTPGTYVFTIPAGAIISSNSTGVAALTTGTCWPAGSTITLVNNGSIYGMGGNGGRGGGIGGSCAGAAGGWGGPAIGLSFPLTIDNTNGYILGGGGGGGGGGAISIRGSCAYVPAGGGGGGQGSANSSGGSGACSASTCSQSGGTGTAGGPGGRRRRHLAQLVRRWRLRRYIRCMGKRRSHPHRRRRSRGRAGRSDHGRWLRHHLARRQRRHAGAQRSAITTGPLTCLFPNPRFNSPGLLSPALFPLTPRRLKSLGPRLVRRNTCQARTQRSA